MARTATKHTIEADTSILPYVVADSVINTAEHVAAMEIPNHEKILRYLVDHAEQIYTHNRDFKKKIQSHADHGNAGRDHLYVFMEHWLGAYLKRHHRKLYEALPDGYGWSYSPSIRAYSTQRRTRCPRSPTR